KTTSAANGPHTLGLTVTDTASTTATATRSVTVQNGGTPPTAGFTSPSANQTVAGAAFAVNMTASGGGAPYTYRLTIDGIQVFSTTTNAGTAAYSWNTTTYANGAHTLALTVT